MQKLQVTQVYGLETFSWDPFPEPGWISKNTERAQTNAYLQERKSTSTSMMKILRIIEIMYLIKDSHVRFQKKNQGK